MCMAIGHIEVVHPVAIFAAITVYLCRWTGAQPKVQAVLGSFAAWLQTHFHDAFSNWRAITEGCGMAHGVIHAQLLLSSGKTPSLRPAWMCAPSRHYQSGSSYTSHTARYGFACTGAEYW